MRFLITDDHGTVLATLEAPPEGAVSVAIEREDEPDLLFASADLYGDGSVHVGHWPNGVEWEVLLRATGTPNPYGSSKPRMQPAPPPGQVSAQEIAELLDSLPLDEDVLDVAVHEAFAEQASEVNNQGLAAQVEYLAGRCADVHALRDLLTDLTA
ncbi:hypothetical protein ACFWUQ_09215 [Streptomyces sp. NPDC058662]|uniref:hypothetical protein n=1 Tax=Streptomyces sp. NPDC058662 TaxID=3346583 RepID=UPI00364B517F